MSMESLRLMMGGKLKQSSTNTQVEVYRNANATIVGISDTFVSSLYDGASQQTITSSLGTVKSGATVQCINFTQGTRITLSPSVTADLDLSELNLAMNTYQTSHTGAFAVGDEVRFFWTELRGGSDTTSGSPSATEIEISPSTFPGTYKIIGDTFIRSQDTGADSAFQFIVHKGKVSSNTTIQLQAGTFGLYKLRELLEA